MASPRLYDMNSPTHQQSTSYLTHLPKAELHIHLEGTITPATLVALSQRHDDRPLSLPEAQALYTYKDFGHFLDVWSFVCQRIRTPHDYTIIVHDMLESLISQSVKHVEVYVAVGGMISTRPSLVVAEVFAAIEGVRLDYLDKISVLWIVDASRKLGPDHVKTVFDIAATLRQKYPAVVGVGIGGNEAAGPCRLFKDIYQTAKQRGLRLTAHCGEATGPIDGPKEIRDAVNMGVERLGHAFCAQYDDLVMDELRMRRVVLELNVTSNLRTNVCRAIEEHPIKKYCDRGLICTINSDDPAMFGSNILGEYVLVHTQFGFSFEDMKGFAENSFRYSFLGEEDRASQIDLVKTYWDNVRAAYR